MSRPRSARAHRKVLRAALTLLAERGIEATSMDAIAGRSGVSKATIYNHWADKEALLLEAMAELHGLHDRPVFDSGNTRADIVAVLSYRPSQDRAGLRERIMPDFFAYSAHNPKFGHAWRKMVTEPARQDLKRLLAQGVQRGELAPLPDLDFAVALLLGPILYCHIFGMTESCRPEHLPERVVEAFWRAFQPEGESLERRVERRGSVDTITRH